MDDIEFDDMVSVVHGWFLRQSDDNKKEFVESSKQNLIAYHTTLGRSIRNEFKLWEREWVPDIREGVDHSEDHPDRISMRVIEAVWDRLHNS